MNSMVATGPSRAGQVRPLRRLEYDQLVELGAFAEERLELLHGMLVTVMSPQRPRHAETTSRLAKRLVRLLGDRGEVRVQCPLAVSGDSEPEPDVAVVPPGDYSREHPRWASLVIEVAEDSLEKDRTIKSRLYAAAGVPEYWIVNLVDDLVEVHTCPSGEAYATAERAARGQTLRLVRHPDVEVAVDEVIPGR